MKDTSYPTFPTDEQNHDGKLYHYQDMTLRDYFIAHVDLGDVNITVEEAKALTGEDYPNWRTDYMNSLKYWAKVEAILKGIKADAMLAERRDECE